MPHSARFSCTRKEANLDAGVGGSRHVRRLRPWKRLQASWLAYDRVGGFDTEASCIRKPHARSSHSFVDQSSSRSDLGAALTHTVSLKQLSLGVFHMPDRVSEILAASTTPATGKRVRPERDSGAV